MIFNIAPTILFFLVIVFIEQFYIQKAVQLSRTKVIWYTFCANTITTFLGLPLLWIVMYFSQLFIDGMIFLLGGVDLETLSFPEGRWGNIKWTLSAILYVILLEPVMGSDENIDFLLHMLSGIILYIPAFFLSFHVEYTLLKKWIKVKDLGFLKKICFKANLASWLVAGEDDMLYKCEATKEELWDKYYIQAPAQLRQPVEKYKIVKRA